MIASTFIASALATATPLAADLSEGVACVIEQTSPADRLAIADGALGDGGAGEQAAAAEDRYSTHLAACAERFGWNEPQLLRVSTLGIGAMVRQAALARLAGAGIDGAALDLWFDRQSEEFRTTAFYDMAEDEAAAAIMTLENAVVPPELLEAHSGLIGGYLAMLVLAERIARGLPAE